MRGAVLANLKRLVVWLVAVALVAASAGVVWWDAGVHEPREGALAAAEAETSVDVVEREGGYVLRDGEAPAPDTALVFYPGANVEPESYVPLFAPVVERTGVRVYLPDAPLNLAILDPDRAAAYQDRARAPTEWYVGGHSLGGAMACRYASNHADRVDGVVLLGSYCSADVSDSGLPVLQVLGARDGVVDRVRLAASAGNLPANATTVTLAGVNHSQFGSYTGQRGDRPGTVGYERAHARIRAAVVGWLAQESPSVSADGASVVDVGSENGSRLVEP